MRNSIKLCFEIDWGLSPALSLQHGRPQAWARGVAWPPGKLEKIILCKRNWWWVKKGLQLFCEKLAMQSETSTSIIASTLKKRWWQLNILLVPQYDQNNDNLCIRTSHSYFCRHKISDRMAPLGGTSRWWGGGTWPNAMVYNFFAYLFVAYTTKANNN